MSAEPSPPIVTPGASTEGGGAAVPRRARRSWTSWEDQTLRSRIAQYGESRGMWKEIAQAIPGRTAKVSRVAFRNPAQLLPSRFGEAK